MVLEPQVDNSIQMLPPASQNSWLDSNIVMENLKNYLARPVYSHVLEPVGSVSQTYITGPVYSHVLEPVGSASQTYVTGPVYSHVLEPVGSATNSYVIAPVGSATQTYVLDPVGTAVSGTGKEAISLTVPDDNKQVKPQPITPLINPDDLAQQLSVPPQPQVTWYS